MRARERPVGERDARAQPRNRARGEGGGGCGRAAAGGHSRSPRRRRRPARVSRLDSSPARARGEGRDHARRPCLLATLAWLTRPRHASSPPRPSRAAACVMGAFFARVAAAAGGGYLPRRRDADAADRVRRGGRAARPLAERAHGRRQHELARRAGRGVLAQRAAHLPLPGKKQAPSRARDAARRSIRSIRSRAARETAFVAVCLAVELDAAAASSDVEPGGGGLLMD